MLVVTPAIANLIRENKVYRINSSIQTGHKLGMQLLDDHMFKLWQQGLVEEEEALVKSNAPDELRLKIARVKKSLLEDEEEAQRRMERPKK
jgi:twitching motility protein PilT